MRAYLYTAIAALVLFSCTKPSDNLTKLQVERDSLKTVKTEINAQIQIVEAAISAMDTNNRVRITTVTTIPVEPAKFEHFFSVQGIVETDQNAQIFPEANGKITAIKVAEGDRVSKGQVLMTIDSRIVSNQIDEVKSRLELAKTVFEKQEKLWEQNIGSEIQYLESKNNYESLKQNLETLQAQQALYTVTAPFSGIIDEINPKEGEMATPAMPAFRLINMDEMYIKADVTERYLREIKAGDSVIVKFPSVGETKYTTIDRIGNFINPNNRSFKIKLLLDNKNMSLKPNLLGELSIRDYVKDSAVVIPTSLIQMTPSGDEFVYVVNQGESITAQKVMIKSGLSYNDHTEIVNGLTGNEVLIDKGARSIKDGDLIQIEG